MGDVLPRKGASDYRQKGNYWNIPRFPSPSLNRLTETAHVQNGQWKVKVSEVDTWVRSSERALSTPEEEGM